MAPANTKNPVKPSTAKFETAEDLGRFILFQLGMDRRRGSLYVYKQPGGAVVLSPVALEGVYQLDFGEKPN